MASRDEAQGSSSTFGSARMGSCPSDPANAVPSGESVKFERSVGADPGQPIGAPPHRFVASLEDWSSAPTSRRGGRSAPKGVAIARSSAYVHVAMQSGDGKN